MLRRRNNDNVTSDNTHGRAGTAISINNITNRLKQECKQMALSNISQCQHPIRLLLNRKIQHSTKYAIDLIIKSEVKRELRFPEQYGTLGGGTTHRFEP